MRRIVVCTALLLAACSDGPSATRALENIGMTEIEITGYRFFGCDEKDTWHTGFRAKNPQGKTVTGVVCDGWLKGATVRFD